MMTKQLGQTRSILVVEDDEVLAEVIRAVLNDVAGWGSTVVHDASAATAVFRHVPIDVLVLEVNLPSMPGLELVTLLRQDPNWNEPPIILMSADAGQLGINDALRAGLVTALLRKPFDIDQLIHEIDAA